MPASAATSLRRALERADLLDAALRMPDSTGSLVTSASGTVHSEWARRCMPDLGRRRAPAPHVTLRQLLDATDVCSCVDEHAARSVLHWDVRTLLDITTEARSGLRRATKPGAASGATARQIRLLQQRLAELDMGALRPELAAEAAVARRNVQAALDALAVSLGTVSERTAILEKVRTELTPRRLRGKAHFDDTPHVIGVYPPLRGTDAIRDVLLRLAVAPGSERQVLVGPRWVADYLYREMYRAQEFSLVTSVAVGDVPADRLPLVTEVWDPVGDGPMSDLAAAVEACRATT